MENAPAQENILNIHDKPTLDEVWDLCVRNFIYDQNKYVNEVLKLFNKLGITKESRIADLSAGGGFPAQNLIEAGYKVDCFDGFASDLFNENSEKQGLTVKCEKILWKNIPNTVQPMTYDFIFCRGNSFIYADGGWTELSNFDIEKVRASYIETARIFHDILKENGYLYIDKFKDSELGHREKLATIKVGEHLQDLLFSSIRTPETKTRQVFMQRAMGDDIVNTEERVTYDLSEKELAEFLGEGGFSEVKKINTDLPEEKHFDVWLAKK